MTSTTMRTTAPAPVPRDTRTLTRWVAALMMPVGPAAIAILRFMLPYDTNDTPSEMVAAIAADQAAQEAVLWLSLVAAFTLLPGAIAVLALVRPYAPRLTLATAAFLLPGYLALAATGAADTYLLVGLRTGVDPETLTRLVVGQNATPQYTIAISVFVIGHIVGSVLLGVALWRSGLVSRVWAIAMTVSQPLHLFAAMTGNHPLDLVAWSLTALAMGAAAYSLLRLPNDLWQVPGPRPKIRR